MYFSFVFLFSLLFNILSISPECDNIPPPVMTPTEEEEIQQPSSDITPSETVEAQPKKSCKEKSKKCKSFLYILCHKYRN